MKIIVPIEKIEEAQSLIQAFFGCVNATEFEGHKPRAVSLSSLVGTRDELNWELEIDFRELKSDGIKNVLTASVPGWVQIEREKVEGDFMLEFKIRPEADFHEMFRKLRNLGAFLRSN